MAETAMSASILHKETEIDHNGVHYKVVVDAEKQHDHSLSGLESGTLDHEHEDESAKIGVHYELPDIEHLHHHGGEYKHHGVVIHIDLGGAHGADDEHLDDEEHHDQEHHEEHLITVHPYHDANQYHYDTENDNLEHHVHPDLGHHDLEQDQTLSYEDLVHRLTHHDGENELKYDVDVPHPHHHHHTRDSHVWGGHHGKKHNYVVAHQKGNLWHLFNLNIVKPVKRFENEYEQGDINEQPIVELHELHHHVDVHH